MVSFWVGRRAGRRVGVWFRRVVGRALAGGCCSWLLRSSSRSFSGWVAACSFLSRGRAWLFAAWASSVVGVPVVARLLGSCWVVSVPVVRRRGGRPSPLGDGGGVPLLQFLSSLVVLRAACAGCLGGCAVAGVPGAVASVVASASVVGFSGSRSVAPPSSLVSAVAALVSPSASVSVGCAGGVDAAFRSAFPDASVFQVASFGSGRGAFAARSVACVRSCLGGVWLSFPAGPCPAGLVPSSSSSACFCGAGSGSWASLAFAVGLGVASFCWLPPGVAAPAWLVPAGDEWFAPAAAQLGLF